MFINTNLKDIHPHNAYGIYNNLDISWYHQPLIAHPAGHGGGALEPRPLRRGGEEGFPRLWRPPTSVESSGDLGLGIPIKPKWWLLASVFWGFGSQMVGYGGVMCENGGCKLYPRKNGFVSATKDALQTVVILPEYVVVFPSNRAVWFGT